MYVTRALLPHLQDEIRINKKSIEEANKMILHHSKSKPTTRRQHQQMLTDPGAPAPCTPRQRTLSSPGTLLCTLDERAVLTEGEMAEEDNVLNPVRAGNLLLEDVSLPASDTSVVLLAIEHVVEEDMTSQEAARQEAALQEAALQEAALKEPALLEAALREAARREVVLQEAARQGVARQELVRQEAARQEVARQEAADRQEPSLLEAGRQEAAQHAANQELTGQEDILI